VSYYDACNIRCSTSRCWGYLVMRLTIRRSLSATGSPKKTPVVFRPGQSLCGACRANQTSPLSTQKPTVRALHDPNRLLRDSTIGNETQLRAHVVVPSAITRKETRDSEEYSPRGQQNDARKTGGNRKQAPIITYC